MKRSTLTVVVLMLIVLGLAIYFAINSRMVSNTASEENRYYQQLLNKEITGTELSSVINKVIDSNKKNELSLDDKKLYIENDENSIVIEINFKYEDGIKTIRGERIFNGEIHNFISHYGNIKFKCSKLEYHDSTKKVKKIYIDEI
jgi:Na+-translocating ferredoxin:NAD+ oxidoreductase RnfG subunit